LARKRQIGAKLLERLVSEGSAIEKIAIKGGREAFFDGFFGRAREKTKRIAEHISFRAALS
jgi:hypothetical protein